MVIGCQAPADDHREQILVLTLPEADRLPSRYEAALPHHWQRGLSYLRLVTRESLQAKQRKGVVSVV